MIDRKNCFNIKGKLITVVIVEEIYVLNIQISNLRHNKIILKFLTLKAMFISINKKLN